MSINHLYSIPNEKHTLQYYLNKVSNIKILLPEEEISLFKDFKNNQSRSAAEKIIISHLPLVIKVAMKFKGYGLPITDLIAEGNVGLVRAIDKFDPNLGNRFATYAIWWIRAHITDFILDSWSIVKRGTLSARKKLFFSLQSAKRAIGATGRESNNLSDEEASQIVDIYKGSVTKQDIIDVNDMISNKVLSVHQGEESPDGDRSIGGSLVSYIDNPEQEATNNSEDVFRRKSVHQALSHMSDKEKFVVSKRYLSENPQPLSALAQEMHLSREGVRQIEKRAIAKAKQALLRVSN